MTIIMVDIESDGPIPHDYSMVSFGAVVVDQALDKTFYGQLKPISDKWIPEALAVSGFSREQILDFDDPQLVMQQFSDWLKQVCGSKPMFFSDNNGFTEVLLAIKVGLIIYVSFAREWVIYE